MPDVADTLVQRSGNIQSQSAPTDGALDQIRQLTSLPTELEACQQTDVTWCAANALLRGATCPAWRREFRPLASELLPRFPFVTDAALCRLIDGEAGGGGNVELATPGDIELRHSVSHRHHKLRTQHDHRD
jgi:hypothetical protein